MQFTIIIPMWNSAKTIHRSLNSLQQQTLPGSSWEIIVIDDGSLDQSAKIVSAFAQSNPQLNIKLIQRNNTGAGASRNYGITQATGKYIIFLDADDCLLPDALSIFARTLAQNPDTQLIFSNFQVQMPPVTANSMDCFKNFDLKLPLNVLQNSPSALWLMPPAPWAKVYQKQFLQQNPDIKFSTTTCYEDLGFYLRLLQAKPRWLAIPNYTYKYYYTANSLMNSKELASNRQIIDVLNTVEKEYRIAINSNKEIRQAFEAVTAYHGFLAVITRLLKAQAPSSEFQIYQDFIQEKYPNWLANPRLSKAQKLLGFIYQRRYWSLARFILWLKAKARNLLSN